MSLSGMPKRVLSSDFEAPREQNRAKIIFSVENVKNPDFGVLQMMFTCSVHNADANHLV